MEHENEILGTLMVIMFDLLVAFFIYLFIITDIPLALAIIVEAALGVMAIYATYKVGVYWYNKLKARKSKEE